MLVLDRKDRFLSWVTPDYANRALARAEVERTDYAGTVRVVDGWFNRLDGNGKPMSADAQQKAKR